MKQQIRASEKGKAKAAQRQARDDAYHEALGLAKGVKLPKSLGNRASAGGGRDRRGKATGPRRVGWCVTLWTTSVKPRHSPQEGVQMSGSPEQVVRNFLAAFADPNLDELVSFFSDDALFIDGPRGVHRGVDAVRSELESELAMGFGSVKIDVHSLISDGGIVMMEGTENYRIGGKPFSLEVMGAFHVDADGRITRWRYSYDLRSVTDQIEAAGFKAPDTA